MVTALRPQLRPFIARDEPDALVDEEIEMQTYGDDGAWHRRAIGEHMTACGDRIPLGATLRHNSYDGRLCSLCFTPFELAAGKPGPTNGVSR